MYAIIDTRTKQYWNGRKFQIEPHIYCTYSGAEQQFKRGNLRDCLSHNKGYLGEDGKIQFIDEFDKTKIKIFMVHVTVMAEVGQRLGAY